MYNLESFNWHPVEVPTCSILLLEQEVLNMEVAQAQALQNLNEDPEVTRMIAPRNVRYANTDEFMKSSASSSAASSTAAATSSVSSGTGSSSSKR